MLDGNEKNGRPCRTIFELGFSTLPCQPFEVASASEDRIEQAAESKEVREVLWSRKSFVVCAQNRRCPDWSTILRAIFKPFSFQSKPSEQLCSSECLTNSG